jgi:hypothetical protein
MSRAVRPAGAHPRCASVATLSTTHGYTASDGAYRGQVPHVHRHRHDEPVVQSVTSVPESLADEQSGRIRRYLITMAIRTLCFIGAVVTATQGAPWWLWGTFAVLAILLPYVAVVLANAVRPRPPGSSAPVTPGTDGPDQIGH